MYAIIEIGGRQYNVEKGSKVRCEKLDQEVNSSLTIDKVLVLNNGDQTKIGHPYVEGASVTAKVAAQGRGKKVVVFKYHIQASRLLTYYAAKNVDLEAGLGKKFESLKGTPEAQAVRARFKKYAAFNKMLTPMAKYYGSELSDRKSTRLNSSHL